MNASNGRSGGIRVAVGVAVAAWLYCGTALAQTCPPPPPGAQYVLYAARDGSPTGTCTCSVPCTLTRAMSRVRELNGSMTGDIVVRLRGGTYSLTQTLQFDASDSGKNSHKVFWMAYPGETPVLSGGTRVTGWSLADDGVTYRAAVPASFETRQLWINDVRGVRARGALNPAGFALYPANCPGPNHTIPCIGYSSTNTYMKDWHNPADIEVMGINQWKSLRCGISSISTDGTVITMDDPCFACAHLDIDGNGQDGNPGDYPIGLPTWIENARELLDEYGEWYLDRTVNGGSRTLYYKPRPGETITGVRTQVIAATLDGPLVKLLGTPAAPVENIVFSGLTFSHATWLTPNTTQGMAQNHADYYLKGGPSCSNAYFERADAAVEVEYANNLEFSDNRFTRLGRSALSLRTGVSQSIIQRNEFSDLSGTGVLVGHINPLAPAYDEVWGLEIKNNYVARAGVEYFGAVGMLMTYARNNTISNNEIFSVPYNGLNVGWFADSDLLASNEFSGNLIHQSMSLLNDGGLVYTRSDQNGSSFNGNFLHNQNNMVAGLYIDNGSAGLTVGGGVDPGNVVIAAPLWRALNQSSGPPAHDNLVTCNWADREDWATVEAENYTRFQDATPGNYWNTYRFDDVDVYACPGCTNGYAVGYTQNSEWLEIDEDMFFEGGLDLTLRVAKATGSASVKVCIHDAAQQACGAGDPVIAIPTTQDWNTFVTTSPITVYPPYPPNPQLPLVAGRRAVRLEFTGGFNLDNVRYKPSSLCCGSNTVDPNTIVTNCSWPAAAQDVMNAAGLELSYRGMPGPVTRYEAEDFNIGGEGVKSWTPAIDCRAAYHDLTPGNAGGPRVYRGQYDVDIYAQWSASNGYTMGFIQEGEWVRYNVDLREAGTYAFDLSLATTANGNSVTLEVDGVTNPLATVNVPNTGAFDNYQKVAVPWTPTLTSGFHVVRLLFHGPGFVFDYFETRKLP